MAVNDGIYQLQKYAGAASRFTCPGCGKAREFSRYINTHTGEYLADHVGCCNRESKCGYHYKPKDYFQDIPQSATHTQNNAQYTPRVAQFDTRNALVKCETPSFLPDSYLKNSLSYSEEYGNNLFDYVKRITGVRFSDCVKRFHIGGAKKWAGSTVFWQVDVDGNVRSGKIILYDPTSGKRIKTPFNHITWVHAELKRREIIPANFNFVQCLFGEHQLNQYPGRPVAVVESEKTAVIASAYLPDYIWLACGGLNGINPLRFEPLKNRSVILYPDINGFEKWSEKADTLKKLGFRISVSDLLEKAGFVTNEEQENGYDLGDYLPQLEIPLTPLEKMIAKNSKIVDLIKLFDLVEL